MKVLWRNCARRMFTGKNEDKLIKHATQEVRKQTTNSSCGKQKEDISYVKAEYNE